MLTERVVLYKKLEKLRGRPLIVYVTSQRPNATGQMATDVIPGFIEQMQSLPPKTKSVDLLLESTGGDGLVAWRIMSLLRSKVKKVHVIIPYSAFSAATMLALGGDEIVMGKYGCLGPIDPQITAIKKDGSTQQFAYEDIISYINFTKNEAGLSEQKHIEAAFKLLCETVEPALLGMAKRASSLSVTIGEKLLQMHMTDPESRSQAKVIAEKLNRSFFSHGHALSGNQAKEIGLNIIDTTTEEEEIIWKIHKDFEKETETNTPFDPIAIFMAHPNAGIYLQSPPPIHIPPMVNQQVALQIMNQYITSQLTASVPDVQLELKQAFTESPRIAYEFKSRIKILVTRTLDMKFISSIVNLNSKWEEVLIPSETEPITPEIVSGKV
jgi:hypothetical protein